MKINLSELSPWSEVARYFLNMKSLTINGHKGAAEISGEDGHVALTFKVKAKKKRIAPGSTKASVTAHNPDGSKK